MSRPFAIVAGVCVFYIIIRSLLSGPDLAITTRPDGQNAGNLGIGLRLKPGKFPAYTKDGGPLMAHIEIKTSTGNVVHQATEKLETFSFG